MFDSNVLINEFVPETIRSNFLASPGTNTQVVCHETHNTKPETIKITSSD